MLAFIPGAEVIEAGDDELLLSRLGLGSGTRDPADLRILEFELPPELQSGVEPGSPHDVTLGIAVQAAERYYLIASDSWDDVELEDGRLELRAELGGPQDSAHSGLEVRFIRD